MSLCRNVATSDFSMSDLAFQASPETSAVVKKFLKRILPRPHAVTSRSLRSPNGSGLKRDSRLMLEAYFGIERLCLSHNHNFCRLGVHYVVIKY